MVIGLLASWNRVKIFYVQIEPYLSLKEFTDNGHRRLRRASPRNTEGFEMDALTRIGWMGFIALTLAVSGGGGDTQPAGTGVGAAGGTGAGPNGAKVVIPAGALATDITINIAQIVAKSRIDTSSHSMPG
jgi:hypothetical protein